MPGQSRVQPTPKFTAASQPAASSAAPPPPPPPRASAPPPPPAHDKPMYKALYAFQGQEGEITLAKDDVVEMLEKDDNGMSFYAFDYTSRLT